ncbi:GtrA family protein [Streptomyces sp. NPDC002516]
MGSASSGPQEGPRSAVRQRFDLLVREVAKFGAVGGAGLLVNLLVFNLVRHLTGLQVVRASVVATVVSIVFNYIGFRYFTYRDRDKGGRTKELTLFLLFSVVGLVIENGVLYAATYGFGWDSPLQSNVFKFVGIGVATLFRFWSYRTWVFQTLPAREAVASAESFLDEVPAPDTRRSRARVN